MKKITATLCMFGFFLQAFAQKDKNKLDSLSYYEQRLCELKTDNQNVLLSSEQYQFLQRKRDEFKFNSKYRGGGIYFFTGVQETNYTALDKRISSLSLNLNSNLIIPFGLGICGRNQSLIIGTEFSCSKTSNARNIYLLEYISTHKIRIQRSILSPRFGIGYVFARNYYTIPTNNIDFNDYLSTNPNLVELKYENVFLDYSLVFKRKNKTKNFHVPTLAVGYRMATVSKPWMLGPTKTIYSSSPKDKPNQFYAQLIYGIIQ